MSWPGQTALRMKPNLARVLQESQFSKRCPLSAARCQLGSEFFNCVGRVRAAYSRKARCTKVAATPSFPRLTICERNPKEAPILSKSGSDNKAVFVGTHRDSIERLGGDQYRSSNTSKVKVHAMRSLVFNATDDTTEVEGIFVQIQKNGPCPQMTTSCDNQATYSATQVKSEVYTTYILHNRHPSRESTVRLLSYVLDALSMSQLEPMILSSVESTESSRYELHL